MSSFWRPFLLLLVCLPALAAAAPIHPGQFGWVWPVELSGEGHLWQVEASKEIHEAFADPHRGDVAIFDSQGEAVPMGRVDDRDLASRETRWIAVPVYPLPGSSDGRAIDVRLHIETRDDKSLHLLGAGVGAMAATQPVGAWVLDTSDLDEPIRALQLRWSGTEDRKARLTVEASDDLERWSVLVPAATVIDLKDGDLRLSRQVIRLPGARRQTYLRLRTLEPVELPALRVEAQMGAGIPSRAPSWLEATLVSSEIEESNGKRRGIYLYDAAFADVEALRVIPKGPALADVVVSNPGDGPFQAVRGRFPLVRVGDAEPREEPIATGAATRRWKLEVSPPLDQPPRLELSFLPDRYLFLARGKGPFVFAAGSIEARGAHAPVEAALQEVRARAGEGWQPPTAALGGRKESAGRAAITPVPKPRWPIWLLWGVLSLGALAVAFAALQLLRTGRPSEPTRS